MTTPNDIIRTQMMLSLGTTAKNPLLNIVALNLFEIATRSFPVWSNWARVTCCTRRKKGDIVSSSLQHPKSSITCERGVTSSTATNRSSQHQTIYQTRMDAVIHYVTTLPAMKSLLSVTHHDYLPNEFEPVCLENDVYFELLDMKIGEGALEIVKFKLFAYEHDVQHLQVFIDNCNADYERRMANKLGSHRYFFDQVVQTKVKGSTQNPLPTTHLLYTKTKFTTNRTFENVFYEDRKHVETRTKFFLENRAWYDKKGIPYTLGFMFHGPPGTGKCLGKDTPIIMADGSTKLVQDIDVGDKIMGDDSTPRNVLTLARGQEELYRITPTKGDSYVVNESHILSLKISSTKNYSGVKKGEVVDICVRDYLKLSNSKKTCLKGYKVGITFDHKDVPFDPYLFGYWLGDGCSTKTQITTSDCEIVEHFKNELEHIGLEIIKGSDKYGWNIRSQQCKDNYSPKGSNSFLTFLKHYKLINNKHIPDIYKYNSRDVQLQVLAGILDADGSSDNCGYDICLVNEKLLDDVIYISRSLGFAAFKKPCRKACTNGKNGPVVGTYYRTNIHGNGVDEIPVILPRKHVNKRKQIKDVLVTGIIVEPIGVGDYYGFEIDGNHRFMLGDFTVTHNTSSVKAIANEGRRHIVNVQLSEIKTKTQLQHLFFNDEIHVYNGVNTEKYTIPVSERLYVIEDIDAMGDAVLRREWKRPTPKKQAEEDIYLNRKDDEKEKEQFDLSFLLNLLDGTLEANGRILIITTNFPERIDKALIRPGRVDMIVNFKKCNRNILQEMVDSFYETHHTLPDDATLDYKWSPAEVNQILFRNFGDHEQAILDLQTLTNDDLYGFVENELVLPTLETTT